MNTTIANMIVGAFVLGAIGLIFWMIKNMMKKPIEFVETKECILRRETIELKFDTIKDKVDDLIRKQDAGNNNIGKILDHINGAT